MSEFYLWREEVSIFVTFLFALCILSQATAVALSFYRHPRSRVRLLEFLLEIAVLGNVFVCSLMHGATREARVINIVLSQRFVNWRIALFTAIVLLAAAITVLTRKLPPLIAVAAACLTLPIVESLTGNAFAAIFIAAAFIWLIRGIFVGITRYKAIRTNLSALSVKQLIDSMDTGVMFCEYDGFGLLSNKQMQRLMLALTGEIQRNGRKFYEHIGNQNVVTLPDSSAWMFTQNELLINKRVYIQLTATDITERWKLTDELQTQNKDLLKTQEELNSALENLYELSRQKQTQKIKMRTHDVLSERLTLMQRAIRKTEAPDQSLLRELSQGLLDELKAEDAAPTPQDELDTLRQTFASIGVEVLLDGELPEDLQAGQLFADITREAVSNAVRHGFASRIAIRLESNKLIITDNGRGASEEIKEGGGLSGMRRRLEQMGGNLTVNSLPEFKVVAEL